MLRTSIDAVQNVLAVVNTAIPIPTVNIAVKTVSAFLTIVKSMTGAAEGVAESGEALTDRLEVLEGTIFSIQHTVEWTSTMTLYHQEFVLLRYARRKLVIMQGLKNDAEKKKLLSHLKTSFVERDLEMRLESLLHALGVEKNDTLDSDILLNYYNYSNGNRSNLAILSLELTCLIVSGMSVLHLIREPGMKDYTGEFYTTKLGIAGENIKRVLDRCKKEYNKNMTLDINNYFATTDQGKNNSDIAGDIVDLLTEKYDWLDISSIVYTGKSGDSNIQPSKGHVTVDSNGKCCIVIVQEKLSPESKSEGSSGDAVGEQTYPSVFLPSNKVGNKDIPRNKDEAPKAISRVNRSYRKDSKDDEKGPNRGSKPPLSRQEEQSILRIISSCSGDISKIKWSLSEEDFSSCRVVSIRNRTLTQSAKKSDIQFAPGSSGHQCVEKELQLRKIIVIIV